MKKTARNIIEKNTDRREDALTLFKRNFKKADPVFAGQVKLLCNLQEYKDEQAIRTVASLLLDDKKLLPARQNYLAIMLSEINLGRAKNLPRALGEEGSSKLRAVLGIVCGVA